MFSEEVKKFNDISYAWWDEYGPFELLHKMKPILSDYVHFFTQLKGKRVLDLGCGGGIFSEQLACLGARVVALDPSGESIKVAREHYKKNEHCLEGSVEYRHETLADYLLHHSFEAFDVVCCFEVIEHVDEPNTFIHEISQCLVQDGWLFLSTINRTARSYLEAIVAAEYLLKVVPVNTHEYQKFVKPSEINEYASACSLCVKDILGIGYNPFKKKLFTRKNIDVNYMCAFQLE